LRQSRIEEILPLSPFQEGLYFHALYDTSGPDFYNVQYQLDLEKPLDDGALQRAAEVVLSRHSALRASFRQRASGEPVQVIERRVPLHWQQVDLTCVPEDQREEELENFLAEERAAKFDLGRAPLIRFALVRISPERHCFAIMNHHILLDGWSMPVLLAELFACYAGKPAPSGARQYRDFLSWLRGQDRDAADAAWRTALSGITEATVIVPRGVNVTGGSLDRVAVALRPDVSEQLVTGARGLGVTVNTLVQGAWGVLLSRLTGRDDVVFGATVSGRPPELEGVEGIVGLFINTVPVRVRLDPAEPAGAMLARLQQEQAALIPHHYLGLTDIHRITGQRSLFDTALAFQSYPLGDAASEPGAGLRIGEIDIQDAVHYPLTMLMTPGERLHVRIDYRPELFGHETAAPLADAVASLLERIVSDSDQPVAALADIYDEKWQRFTSLLLGDAGPAAERDKEPSPQTDREDSPRNEREAALCRMLAEILEVPEVGIHDDFFELGGNSLLAAKLMRRIRAQFGVEADLRALYEEPMVAALADRLGAGGMGSDGIEGNLRVLLPLRVGGGAEPLFCVHPGVGISWSYFGLVQHIDPAHPIYALQSRGITEPHAMPATMSEVVADYVTQIRSVQPKGPYHLLGWSFGGVAAHAMAVELQRSGQEVGMLVMLDSYPSATLPKAPEDDAEQGVLAELADKLGRDLKSAGMERASRSEILDLLSQDETNVAYRDRPILEAIVDAGVNNIRMHREFVPEVFDGDVLFFTAARDRRADMPEPDSWRQHVTGSIQEVLVDCGHMDMTVPDSLKVVGTAVAGALRRPGAAAPADAGSREAGPR
jgi:thioesterase domain-containing protein